MRFAKRRYSVGTWDVELQTYTPQVGLSITPINITWRQLLQVMRELRGMGYDCHRCRNPQGIYEDSDPSVYVQRVDGNNF